VSVRFRGGGKRGTYFDAAASANCTPPTRLSGVCHCFDINYDYLGAESARIPRCGLISTGSDSPYPAGFCRYAEVEVCLKRSSSRFVNQLPMNRLRSNFSTRK
jgi:hypothetical protein